MMMTRATATGTRKTTILAAISALPVLLSTSFCANAQVVGAPVPQSVNISFLQPTLVDHTITLASSVPFSTKIPNGTLLATGRVQMQTGNSGNGIALRWENPVSNTECFVSLLTGNNDSNNILRVNLDSLPGGVTGCDAQGYMNSGSNAVDTVNYSLFKLTDADVPPDTYTATIYAASWQN